MSSFDNNIMAESILKTLSDGYVQEQEQQDSDLMEEEKLKYSTIEGESDKYYDPYDQYGMNNHWESNEKKIFQPEEYLAVLESKLYRNKNKTIKALAKFDIVITYGWNNVHYGPVSAWYDAFELWYMVQSNTLPTDLGGKHIALLFPDCPNMESIIQILKSIFYKYVIDETIFTSLCKSIFFINQPDELILTIGLPPYVKHYEPSNLVFVDGVIPNVPIVADNLFIQTHSSVKEEDLSHCTYNYLLIYLDSRIYKLNNENAAAGLGKDLSIARVTKPNTIIYDDIKRINFNSFRKYIQEEPEKELLKDENLPPPKKRFLLYITPKNRSIYKTFHYDTNSSKWSNQELDDILNAIPDSCLNNIAIQIKGKQKETYNYLIEFNKKNGIKGIKGSKLTEEQLEIVKGKNEIFNNDITINDVIGEEPKAHFILIGLNDENRNFEDVLLARALTRGINISIETYTQKDLPIKDIHNMYDIYLFTPPTRWTTTRFLPEALYHQKKVILTDKAKDTLKWNIPMATRHSDSMNYLMSIAEDDIFRKPKAKIAKHLLNIWN